MRRWLPVLLLLLLMQLFVPHACGEEAAADDDLPPDNHYLVMELTDGSYAVAMVESGMLVCYHITVDGGLDGVMTGALVGMEDPYLVQHSAGELRVDGKAWPDELGFELLSSDGSCGESWRWNGGLFELRGWYSEGYSYGRVIRDGNQLTFYDVSGLHVAIDYTNDWVLTGFDFSSLPRQYMDVVNLNRLGSQAMADEYPGYTLCRYASYNYGAVVNAMYLRVDGERLSMKRVIKNLTRTVAYDAMPMVMDEATQAYVSEVDLPQLMLYSDDEAFIRSAAFAREGVLEDAAVLSGQWLLHGFVWHVQLADGTRALVLEQPAQGGDTVLHVLPVPHTLTVTQDQNDPDALELSFGDGREAQFLWRADGQYHLNSYRYESDDEHIEYAPRPYGRAGAVMNDTLTGMDLTRLPDNAEQLKAMIAASGWAVVSNPDPADRLHLRAGPDRSTASLGMFYNGVPVHVLELSGDWAHVQLGEDGQLNGWMMRRYLAFGDAMTHVEDAMPPRMSITYGSANREPFRNAAMTQRAGWYLQGDETIMGFSEEQGANPACYIVLDAQGRTGYVPAIWYEAAGHG